MEQMLKVYLESSLLVLTNDDTSLLNSKDMPCQLLLKDLTLPQILRQADQSALNKPQHFSTP